MTPDDAPLRGLMLAQQAARALSHSEDQFRTLDGAVTTYADRRRALTRKQQDDALDEIRLKEQHELDRKEQEEANRPRPLKPRDKARLLVYGLCRPQTILWPVNAIELYRGRHPVPPGRPLWPSWAWDVTDEINRQMLPFVQDLDKDDPLPDDPRLALPMTIAGFWLYRALHIDPEGQPRTSPTVVMDVYEEVAQGIAAVERSLSVVLGQLDLADAFRADYYHVAGVAKTLLLHAVRLGPEIWDLILRCKLGAECRLSAPFYVTRPGEDDPHNTCAVAAHRRRAREGRSTRLTPL